MIFTRWKEGRASSLCALLHWAWPRHTPSLLSTAGTSQGSDRLSGWLTSVKGLVNKNIHFSCCGVNSCFTRLSTTVTCCHLSFWNLFPVHVTAIIKHPAEIEAILIWTPYRAFLGKVDGIVSSREKQPLRWVSRMTKSWVKFYSMPLTWTREDSTPECLGHRVIPEKDRDRHHMHWLKQ